MVQVLEVGVIRCRIVAGTAEADAATAFQQHLMAPDEVFLATGERDKAPVGAGIHQLVAVGTPLDAGVLP